MREKCDFWVFAVFSRLCGKIAHISRAKSNFFQMWPIFSKFSPQKSNGLSFDAY